MVVATEFAGAIVVGFVAGYRQARRRSGVLLLCVVVDKDFIGGSARILKCMQQLRADFLNWNPSNDTLTFVTKLIFFKTLKLTFDSDKLYTYYGQ